MSGSRCCDAGEARSLSWEEGNEDVVGHGKAPKVIFKSFDLELNLNAQKPREPALPEVPRNKSQEGMKEAMAAYFALA